MTTPADAPQSHIDAAQARIEEIRAIEKAIPNVSAPDRDGATQALSTAASVPPELIGLTAILRESTPELVHGAAVTPEKLRDLLDYANAYDAVAAELEAVASRVRHSTAAARHLAGTEALTTYALARRLAKRPDSGLTEHVEAMRQILARRFKPPYSKKKREKA